MIANQLIIIYQTPESLQIPVVPSLQQLGKQLEDYQEKFKKPEENKWSEQIHIYTGHIKNWYDKVCFDYINIGWLHIKQNYN